MRKLNVEKMRRHMARTTPDAIEAVFNVMDDDVEAQYQAWLKRFWAKMRIKHPNENFVTDIQFVDDFSVYPNKIVRAEIQIRKPTQ